MTKQYLIAFSGTHGAGKSTTIKNLVASRDDIYEDPIKVSRKIQALLGYKKLEDAYSTPKRMIEFQELILEEKILRDKNVFDATSKRVILTERSYLDVAAYTLQWVNRLLENKLTDTLSLTKWYLRYEKRCLDEMYRYDGVIFVNPLIDTTFDIEPNRADLESRDFIYNTLLEYLKNYNIPIEILESASINSRVNRCSNFIDKLIGK